MARAAVSSYARSVSFSISIPLANVRRVPFPFRVRSPALGPGAFCTCSSRSADNKPIISVTVPSSARSAQPITERRQTVAPRSVTTNTVDEMLLSPMMQQYVATRRRLHEKLCTTSDRRLIMLYRVGDFFESFFEDAHLLSTICGIALTSKEAGKALQMRVPMAGIPHFSLDDKVSMLLAANVTAAIVDQIQPSTAAPSGALVKRAVTRLISPATAADDGLRDTGLSSYIAAVHLYSSTYQRKMTVADSDDVLRFGLAYADVSTGEFCATDGTSFDALQTLLVTIGPCEVVLTASSTAKAFISRVADCARKAGVTVVTTRNASTDNAASQSLASFHAVDDVESLGCRNRPHLIQAAATLVAFVKDSLTVSDDTESFISLNRLATFIQGDFLQLDDVCLKNLEVLQTARDGGRARSLQAAVDRTVTAMGARKLRSWLTSPVRDVSVIVTRQEIVAALMSDAGAALSTVQDELRSIGDLERLGGRISTGRVSPREMRWLCESLRHLPNLFACLRDCVRGVSEAYKSDWVHSLDEGLRLLAEEVCEALVDPAPTSLLSEVAIHSGVAAKENWDVGYMGIFQSGYDNELDSLRREIDEPEAWATKLERQKQDRCGIESLRIKHVKGRGYIVRLPRSLGERKLEEDPTFFTKIGFEIVQGTKAEMRFTFPELKERARVHHSAVSDVLLCERDLFIRLCERMVEYVPMLRQLGGFVARIDVVAGFAKVALERGYCKPHVMPADERILSVHEARHPVVEQVLPTGRTFVSNTLQIGSGPDGNGFADVMLLCGPNAAGKSCALRSLGLIVILAQCGSFVPASHAEISVCDRIFTRVGAVDDVARGQSTFQVEMAETACILSHATSSSLVLLDEIGRGTSTADGISIAWSVAEHLSQRGKTAPRTMFVTHFHELNHLADLYDNVKSFHVRMENIGKDMKHHDNGDESTTSPSDLNDWLTTFVIESGPSYESMGLALAKRAGFPDDVTKRAEEIASILSNPCKALGMQLQEALSAPGTTFQIGKTTISDSNARPAKLVDNDRREVYKVGFREGYRKAIEDMNFQLRSLPLNSEVVDGENNT